MIVVDISALIALLQMESGWEELETVLNNEPCALPAPTLLECATVAVGCRFATAERVAAFVTTLLDAPKTHVESFGEQDAMQATGAAERFGKGRGNRAQLNIIDLMVYAIAKRLGAPILCTGSRFRQYGHRDPSRVAAGLKRRKNAHLVL